MEGDSIAEMILQLVDVLMLLLQCHCKWLVDRTDMENERTRSDC